MIFFPNNESFLLVQIEIIDACTFFWTWYLVNRSYIFFSAKEIDYHENLQASLRWNSAMTVRIYAYHDIDVIWIFHLHVFWPWYNCNCKFELFLFRRRDGIISYWSNLDLRSFEFQELSRFLRRYFFEDRHPDHIAEFFFLTDIGTKLDQKKKILLNAYVESTYEISSEESVMRWLDT